MPEGATVVFSAHGVAPEVHEQARARHLRPSTPPARWSPRCTTRPAGSPPTTTTSCSSGTRATRRSSARPARRPAHIQLVDGPDGVDKVTVRDPAKVVWLSQTTLSVDETMETVDRLKTRLPLLQSPPSDDICYATQNRQHVVKEIAPSCDVVIVVGSTTRPIRYGWSRWPSTPARGAGVPDRLRRRDRRRLAGRRDDGRRHVRRERARRPGHGRAGAPGRARLRRGHRVHDRRGAAHFSLPQELRRDMKAAGRI